MPFSKHVNRFIQTLERHGATVLIQGDVVSRPARLRVSTTDGNTDSLLYLWTITPGGGPSGERPEHERRIQVTGVPDGRFPLEAGTRTVIGGFDPITGVWAFWDARQHSRFSSNSPSFQINLHRLEEAGTHGIAAQRRPLRNKNNHRISGYQVAVAIAPDSLLWYVEHGEALHDADDDADEVNELIEAGPEEEQAFVNESESPEQATRRIEIIETLRRHRDARFRPAVLQAYRYRCAICGTALKLVDAAHIVPVLHPHGTDNVTNGLALCRLHHGAYDNGLLGVQSNYRVVLNPKAIKRLKEAELEAGLEVFQQALPEQISLPNVREVYPAPANLRLGLEIRQFPPRLIV